MVAGEPWAVGSYDGPSTRLTLAARWSGSVWDIMYTPNPGPAGNDLIGIASLSDGKAWAVGTGSDIANVAVRSLAEYFDPRCTLPSATPTPTITPTRPTATPTGTFTFHSRSYADFHPYADPYPHGAGSNSYGDGDPGHAHVNCYPYG